MVLEAKPVHKSIASWVVISSQFTFAILLYYAYEKRTREGSYELIDLTHSFSNRTISWPTGPDFDLKVLQRGQIQGDIWVEANAYSGSEHGGTHLDAPAHFQKGKWRLHQIPLDRLFNKYACVIDLTEKSTMDHDALLESDDIIKWEKQHGEIPAESIVILNTGWGQLYGNKQKFLGIADENTSGMHFPGFSKDAARYLATKRSVHAVGIDTASLDHGPSQTFEAHRELYQYNILGLEHLKDVQLLPARGARIYMFPMAIEDGSGAPCRVIAKVYKEDDESGVGWIMVLALLMAMCLLNYSLMT